MRLSSCLAALLCACTLPALAAEPPRFGLQVGLTDAQGDLRDAVDSKVGINLGAHVTFDLGTGWMVRPRLEYMQFPKWEESDFGSYSTKVSGWSLGADALYYLNGRPQGTYLLAGLGVIAWKADYSSTRFTPGGSVSSSDSTTWNRFAFTAGAGYQFNRTFGLEGRIVLSKIGENDASANLVQAVATFRF